MSKFSSWHFMILKCFEVKSMFMPFTVPAAFHIASNARTHCDKKVVTKKEFALHPNIKKRRQVSHRRADAAFWGENGRRTRSLTHRIKCITHTRSSSSLALSASKCVFVCCASERAFKFVLFILTNKQGPRARTMPKKDAQPLIGHNGARFAFYLLIDVCISAQPRAIYAKRYIHFWRLLQ